MNDQVILKDLNELVELNFIKPFIVGNKALKKSNILSVFSSYVLFDEYSANPTYDQLNVAYESFINSNCDIIIAVGGGSCMDLAKGIKYYCSNNKMVIPNLVAIPTTAGSGSEGTRYAVLYNSQGKLSISDPLLFPNYVLFEPKLLLELPMYTKKSALLDALCQAMEAIWAVTSTSESVEYSRKAIELIKDNYKEYIENSNISNCEAIMMASYYAGRAINITMTTAAHAMSYKLASTLKIQHGHAVGLCLEQLLIYTTKNIPILNKRTGDYSYDEAMKILFKHISIDEFINFINYLDLKFTFNNNKDSIIDTLVNSIDPERLSNNPFSLSIEDLKCLYLNILK